MSFSFNNQYLMHDGIPILPVMGEIHYSRYRDDLWAEALRKCKAGGVTIVATYTFWIHHEEEEGVFEFGGCRNLRRFIKLCKKLDLYVFLRIGPWTHGEVRNGGFPDWLLQKNIPLRCDDDRYLTLVERYWKELMKQVDGLMYKDQGPIIGIQIENEYGHVGGLQGEVGEQHMRTLTDLAKRLGFDTPLYTATGWGGAVTGGLLPVMGGYCEAPWDPRITELEANENYIFTCKRNDINIANEHHVQASLTFRPEDFPYLTAELGGGLQVTKSRRPVVTGQDIGAMSLTKLGCGIGLLGFYMYHGGSNPKGKFSTLQESKANGDVNDVPIINYDFRAPIRQYGQISESYKEIKLLAMFLKEFGGDLAVKKEEIEPLNESAEDMETLRLSWRHDKEHGYVFFNNYQRRRVMKEHNEVTLIGKCDNQVEFPMISIPSGSYGFFPYHMLLDDALLITATATPLCKLSVNHKNIYVFYGDDQARYQWQDQPASILQLSRKEALNAWKVTLDQDYLILSDDYVWEEGGTLTVVGERNTQVKCYPRLTMGIPGFEECGCEGIYSLYERKREGKESEARFFLVEQDECHKTYRIELKYGSDKKDCILELNYTGDGLQIFNMNEMINDHFYTGESLELSMRYFDFPKELYVKVFPLVEGASCFLETWPSMKEGTACELSEVLIRDQIW